MFLLQGFMVGFQLLMFLFQRIILPHKGLVGFFSTFNEVL